jgi:hypothetical protein
MSGVTVVRASRQHRGVTLGVRFVVCALVAAATTVGAFALHRSSASIPHVTSGSIAVWDARESGSKAKVAVTAEPESPEPAAFASPPTSGSQNLSPDDRAEIPLSAYVTEHDVVRLAVFDPVRLHVVDPDTPPSQRPPQPQRHRFVVLLEGVPALRFGDVNGPVRIVDLHTDGPRKAGSALAAKVGEFHDYLIESVEASPSMEIAFTANKLAINESGPFVRIGFPTIVPENSHHEAGDFLPVFDNAPPSRGLHTVKVVSVSSAYAPTVDQRDGILAQLAGPAGTEKQGTWTWRGRLSSPPLLVDEAAQVTEDRHLYYSGLLLGIAGGAAVAALLELVELVAWQRESRRSEAVPPIRPRAGNPRPRRSGRLAGGGR